MEHRAVRNVQTHLKQNTYPGRGIIIGLSPDQRSIYQIYWIMGRSENSRNRIFVLEDNLDVRNEAFDAAKLTDPSLIIYHPIKSYRHQHIVTNGDQTDTIYEALADGGTFEQAVESREFEPDAPHYTPRISGIVDLGDRHHAYKLSILKSYHHDGSVCVRNLYAFLRWMAGLGHGITTYSGDGDPLPSFEGEPLELPIFNTCEENMTYYWEQLDESNRISLLVKEIRRDTGEVRVLIHNKLMTS